MKRYSIICLFAFCFCGCTQIMENKQSDGNAMSILMNNIFAKEEISLSAYYPSKNLTERYGGQTVSSVWIEWSFDLHNKIVKNSSGLK